MERRYLSLDLAARVFDVVSKLAQARGGHARNVFVNKDSPRASRSSTLSPFANIRTTWCTGIRVPRTQAWPWQIAGSMEILSNVMGPVSLFRRRRGLGRFLR